MLLPSILKTAEIDQSWCHNNTLGTHYFPVCSTTTLPYQSSLFVFPKLLEPYNFQKFINYLDTYINLTQYNLSKYPLFVL